MYFKKAQNLRTGTPSCPSPHLLCPSAMEGVPCPSLPGPKQKKFLLKKSYLKTINLKSHYQISPSYNSHPETLSYLCGTCSGTGRVFSFQTAKHHLIYTSNSLYPLWTLRLSNPPSPLRKLPPAPGPGQIWGGSSTA